MNYTIDNQIIKLTVNTLGAEMQSIIKDDKEYLWQGDPTYWQGRAYNIFPYCGRLYEKTYKYDDKDYHMENHGLARYYEFELVNKSYDSLTFKFQYNEDTLTKYPFKFNFYVSYKLVFNIIRIEYKVENIDDKTMYFALGGHPGFNIPINSELNFEDYYVEFENKCNPQRINYSENCLIRDGYSDNLLVDNQKLYLKHDLFDNDIVQYVNADKKVTIKNDKDFRNVIVTYPDMKYVGIWHKGKTDAPYICIEPWTSLPSREWTIEDISKKDDLISLDSEKEYINSWSIEIN